MDEYLKELGLDLSDCVIAAKQLLGYKLVHETQYGRITGYIVETEAYHNTDPASHSFRGQTKRNTSVFQRSGTIYVYFTYGMHWCMNIVTGDEGDGQAVLIRALEPIEGVEIMQQYRKQDNLIHLTNGPAKLTQAILVNKVQNGTNLLDGPLKLEKGFKPKKIVVAPRIGIKQAVEYPWRFYISGNEFVSKLN